MKLSIVILNYNVRYFLEQCILSCKKAITHLDAEILIIDNNSSDDSCAMVKELFPEITVIENKENVGFSKANNQAVAVAKGTYVCILNPDTAVAENTFTEALKVADTIPDLGALGIYLLDGTGSFLPESKRNLPTPLVSFKKMIGVSKHYYATSIAPKAQGPVSVLVGAFMLLRRAVYNEVGGFDEDYFMYGEDIDLSYKLTKAGYTNYYYGALHTLHYKGESTTKDRVYMERFYGAMKIFYKKHFKANRLFNAAVDFGIKMASTTRKISEQKPTQYPANMEAYVLTENLDTFGKIANAMSIEVKAASKNILQDSWLTNTLLIFDAEYMPYQQIFNVMMQQAGRNNKFKIKPPGCNFLLGSDQSDQKGSVIVF